MIDVWPVAKAWSGNIAPLQKNMNQRGCTVSDSLTRELKTLLAQGDKVQPNCGKVTCLQSNPKENFKDGWTVTKKRKRKRIKDSNLDSIDPKKKKPKSKKPKLNPKPRLKPPKKPRKTKKRKRESD